METETKTAEQQTAPATQSTAVAKQSKPVESDSIAQFRARAGFAIAQSQAIAEAVSRIRTTSWGTRITPEVARALADWGVRNGIDVATEVYVLGGNIYFNAQAYLNRLAVLTRAGYVEDVQLEHIGNSDRLDCDMAGADLPEDLPEPVVEQIKREAVEQWQRRRALRIKHSVPEDALDACVATIRVRGVERPFVGCKFVVRKFRTEQNERGEEITTKRLTDPVGVAFPMETVETRSLRRAMKQIIEQVSALTWMREWMNLATNEGQAKIDRVQERAIMAAARDAALPPLGQQSLGLPSDGAYDLGDGSDARLPISAVAQVTQIDPPPSAGDGDETGSDDDSARASSDSSSD